MGLLALGGAALLQRRRS
ncbi:MAG TPA: hypothetical protein ENH80_04295 [Phycisphaerae bacterium]|nr:hypothetical protein [Phycisphaerae bacterium]HDZ43143.1 hypothetical protein [Phycisphaerae bacterium]